MIRRNDHDSLDWLIFILILLSTLGAAIRAQEISYNLTPTHELGEQLWQIPISGKLTMSADGKRVLVACLADSAFYMVDVETGAYRKLKAQYYQNNTFGDTYYRTDQDLRILAEKTTRSGVLRVWDVMTDSLVASKNIGYGYLSAISHKHDKVIQAQWVMRASTLEVVDTLPEPTDAWFDDDRGMVYYLDNRQLIEADVSNNAILRTWSVRPSSGVVRRPSNSNWLYVFSTETNGLKGGSQNLVEAINLSTGQRLTFEKYFWTLADGRPKFNDQPQCFTSSSTTCFAIGDDNTPHYNAVWEFDAEETKSQVITDVRFFFYDRYDPKTLAISPNKLRTLHCWWVDGGDSSILRCNALIPVATSEHEGSKVSLPTDVRVAQLDNMLTVELVGATAEVLITNVQIFTNGGIMVANVSVSDPSVPVRVPIGHLSSGVYRCVVTTTGRELFASITIVR